MLTYYQNTNFRRISSHLRRPKFQIFPEKHALGPSKYVNAYAFGLTKNSTQSFTTQLPFHPFKYNRTKLITKANTIKECGNDVRVLRC